MPPLFPSEPLSSPGEYLDRYSAELASAMATLDRAQLALAAEILRDALDRDATIFCCGNGGSAAIANHMVCDHQKGISTDTHFRPRIVSLSCNVELVTAVSNDIGFVDVFAHPLKLHARKGDVLVTISSSGNSENIVRVIAAAQEIGMRTVAMTGFTGGRSRTMAEAALHVDSTNYGVIEDAHQACMHVLAQILRLSVFPPELLGKRHF